MRHLGRPALYALAAAALLVWLSASSPFFAYPGVVSDEQYYIYSGRYHMYSLGLRGTFRPPCEANVSYAGGVFYIEATIESGAGGVNVLGCLYNWLNPEHPAPGKALFGLLDTYLGLPGVRASLLAVSAAVFGLYVYVAARLYGAYALASAAVVLALGGSYPLLAFLAFLDTPMLWFTMLHLALYASGRRVLSAAALGVAAAFKEQAAALALPLALQALASGDRGLLAALAASLASGLLAGYAPYILLGQASLALHVAGLDGCSFACAEPAPSWGVFHYAANPLYIAAACALLIALGRRGAAGEAELYTAAFSLWAGAWIPLVAAVRPVYPFYLAACQVSLVYSLSAALRTHINPILPQIVRRGVWRRAT